jgi:hypothetical protein
MTYRMLCHAGEVDRMLSEELAPPPEPQTLREEFGKMFKNRLGRSDRCAACSGLIGVWAKENLGLP